MTNNQPKLLHFDKNKLLFLLLNIVGHDPIHDFGNSNRWRQVKDLGLLRAQSFLLVNESDNESDNESVDNAVYGGGRAKFTKYDDKTKTTRRTFPQDTIFKNDFKIQTDDPTFVPNEQIEIFTLIQDIQCDIIIKLFNYILFHLKYNEVSVDLIEFCLLLPYYIGEDDKKELYEKISKEFYFFLSIKYHDKKSIIMKNMNKETTKEVFSEFMQIILNFFSIFFKKSINYDTYGKQNGFEGGEKRKRDISIIFDSSNIKEEDIQSRVEELESILDPINDYMVEYIDNINTGSKESFDKSKESLINKYEIFFNNYVVEEEKRRYLEYLRINFPPYEKRKINERNNGIIVNNKRNLDGINIIMGRFFKELYEKRKDIINKKMKEDQLKMKLEHSNKMDSLTKIENTFVKNFVSFIAKSALFLTGICDGDGKSIVIDSNKTHILNSEIAILRSKIQPLKNENIQPWNNYGGQDQDTRLYDYIVNSSDNYIDISGKTVEDELNKLTTDYSVIDNAATLNNEEFKNKTFCPYTSIMDGMSKCSYRKEKQKQNDGNNSNLEYGNMDFKICNDVESNQFYNGKLTIHENKININLIVKLEKMDIIVDANNLSMNTEDLDLTHVLAHTLENIILAIKNNEEVYTAEDIFKVMFDQSVKSVKDSDVVKSDGDVEVLIK